jgi:transcriptional regulator with XRE-family HTH domain
MNNLADKMTWPELIEKILIDFRISTYQLEQEHNISNSTISKIRNGKSKPTPKIINDLEKALNIKIHTEKDGKVWFEKIHKRTAKQEEIHRIADNNPFFVEWWAKFDDFRKIWITNQIYKADEIDEDLYLGIKENFGKSPLQRNSYPGRTESHNNENLSLKDKLERYETNQDIILKEIKNLKIELMNKSKRIEELEAAVQVLGAKLGITGTLVQILEAVKSGRLS